MLNVRKNIGGYYLVDLRKDGKRSTKSVHRLVAMYFCDNPNNYDQVNHIDENPTNNVYTNLEWCTQNYNINYGNRTKKQIESSSIPVLVYDCSNGNFIKEYSSIKECGRALGIHDKYIVNILKGKEKTSHGYTFKYKYNRDDYYTTVGYRALKKIYQYDGNKLIKEWDSSQSVVDSNKNYNRRYIVDSCKYGIKAYGYYWKYKIDVELK